METVEQFIRTYLSEQIELKSLLFKTGAPFYQKYWAKEYFNHYLDCYNKKAASPEVFVSVENGDQTARVITTEWFGKRERRHRYNLRMLDGRWEIVSKEAECFVCHGSGRRGDLKCHICDGNGWKDYHKTAT